MIRLLSGMPHGVLGLEAVDEIDEKDYGNVVVPAVEAAIAEHGKAHLVPPSIEASELDEAETPDLSWQA